MRRRHQAAGRDPIAARAEGLETRRLFSALPTGFVESQIASGLTSPSAMAFAPDGRLFFAQQNGVIRVVKNGQLLPTPFATLANVDSNGERGLLGLTFDPNFATNNYVYAYYTTTAAPASHNRLSRLTAVGDVAAANSEVDLFDLPSVGTAIWHMGGAIHFGPDGKIYISAGDHQVPGNAQLLNNLMGKILRLNPDGTIPTDNPFSASPTVTGQNKAIWAYGLRNPYTTAFDPGTGRFYINDVGEGSWEEVNQGAAGANYGWSTTEGNFAQATYPGITQPLYTYPHGDQGGSCVVGGAFYTGVANQFPAQYQGKYFFGDFSGGWVRTIDPATKAVAPFATGLSFPTSMTLAPDGSLWYLSRGQGTGGQPTTGALYQIRYTITSPPQITQQPADVLVSAGRPAAFTASASGSGTLAYQWQRNAADIPGATGTTYTLPTTLPADDGSLFRCVVTSAYGTTASSSARLGVTTNREPTGVITTPADGGFYAGGQTITYAGAAADPETGPLPAGAYTWWVDLHHDQHSHPFVAPTTGAVGGSFTVPLTGETSSHVWYRIHLSVTDPAGLTTSTYRDVLPRKANLTLTTNVPGLGVSLDSQPQVLPLTVEGVAGLTRNLSAPATQTVGGVSYDFAGWSDGGAATHDIAFPLYDATYTALYRRTASVYLSDLTPTGTVTNSWGPYEKDTSNGEQAAGDGRPIGLEGVTYAKGLGVHAASDQTYSFTAGQYSRFKADVGLDDEVGTNGSVVFQVFAGATKLFDSGTMTGSSATQAVDLDVSTRSSLRLVVTDGGNGNGSDHADWAAARFVPAAGGAAPDLTAAADTGVSSTDNLTNRNSTSAGRTLQFVVPGTTAGQTVTVYADGTAVGSATAPAGTTTTVITAVFAAGANPLADGAHLITWRQAPAGGGTASAESAGLVVTIDTAGPTAAVTPVTPAPRSAPLAAAETRFSEPVVGPAAAYWSLARDGGTDLLTGSQTAASADAVYWTLGGLSPLTAAVGTYTLGVAAAPAVTDLAGNPMTAAAPAATFAVVAAPAVQSVVVNDGTVQRSMVTSVTVTFDRAIVPDFGAFTLAGRNGAGAGTVVSAANPLADGRTWVLSFVGTPVVGGSPADGVYDLTVSASAVRRADAPAVAMAADYAAPAFHRLYSDADGDGDSDNFDLLQLRPTLLKPSTDPAYKWYFDYDNSGTVDNLDVFQVRSRRNQLFQGY